MYFHGMVGTLTGVNFRRLAVSRQEAGVSADSSFIHLGAYLRTLIAPMLMWGAAVAFVIARGEPGVICVTPVAWLWALWCGGQYIRLSNGHPGRWPLLGPALVGATLGFAMSVLFYVVTQYYMPVGPDPSEILKARNLTICISGVGVLVCIAFSVFTARLTLRKMAQSQ
jgi:hypothetical protein